MRRGLYFFVTFLICSVFIGVALGLEDNDPSIKGLGKFQVFEKLRGKNLSAPKGYIFTISPDENWIVTVDSYPNDVLNLFYIPTARKWSFALETNAISIDLFPNCFSEDSSKIYLKNSAASINPDMDKIEFKESEDIPNMEAFRGSFLGFNGVIKNRSGAYVKSWWGVEQDEGAFDWDYNGNNLYEAVLKEGRSYLDISSSNSKDKISKRINFSIVIDVYVREIKEVPSALELLMTDKDKTKLKRLERALIPDESNLIIYLDELSVSPNEKFLAAIATIYPGTLGFFGVPFGVLIPLENSDLIVYPFSRNVYDKIIWSDDSRRIYYYAQPTAGGGNGTIYRLETGELEEVVKAFPLPREILDFKDPNAGELERHRQIKKFHYEMLSQEFMQEKLIIDIAYSWVLIEGNQIIDLGILRNISKDERKDIDDYIRKLLVGKRAKIVLPDFKKFSEEYIMSLDPFPTLTREDMPRDHRFKEYYGKIHADIIIDGQSATQKIYEETKRWRTIWNKRYLERKRAERYNNPPQSN